MVPGGITLAVGGIKENGFSQVVGPAPDRGKLFLVRRSAASHSDVGAGCVGLGGGFGLFVAFWGVSLGV